MNTNHDWQRTDGRDQPASGCQADKRTWPDQIWDQIDQDEVREIKDEVREMKAEVKTGREDIKGLAQTLDAVEKRLKKVESIQENDIQQEMRQLFDGQRNTLEKFQSVNEINDRVKDIQGAVDVLKVLTVKKV